MQQADLDHRFDYHRPDAEKADRHQRVRDYFKQAAEHMDEELDDGREKALVITALEEAMFWANASIAREMNAAVPIERQA